VRAGTRLRIAGCAVAIAAVALLNTPTGGASTDGPAKGDVAEIEIKNNNVPKFVGPDTVLQGTGTIGIVNHTDPARIGPHTFSIVKKSALPQGEAERKHCGQYHDVCKAIRKAHGIPPHDFDSETPDIEKGEAGWDTAFAARGAKGDSHYFATEDDVTDRSVSAETGKLWYMCAIHPRMQGSIKVVAAR
jgi:hypothetical protein